ncbi:MAG: WD40 repeat domain-containing serine/threonine protein kinase, partial [Planctomycetota bacterium]|nr:WD40 repeat domain-containing serine/threonine protein kinase [Planctomycetota bacterium]
MLSPETVDSAAPASADQARVGTTLGRYRLTRVLGQGGMGVVYEAVDTTLDRRVAVKLLTEAFSGDGEAAQRLMREARASAKLNHPNVVTIHHVGQHESQSFIVMELMEGGCVQRQVEQRGGLPWQEATRIVTQVCRGLTTAHTARLIHRDIKPSNILRSASGVAKLADFGLVRMLDDSQLRLTTTGMLVGSPYYMSPEQCGSDRVDELSDLYSLGATYFALLVGRPPYRGTHPVKICFEHCSAPVPDPRDFVAELPDRCAEIVRRAMAKRPEDRFASAVDMLFALKRALQNDETLPEPSAGIRSKSLNTRRLDGVESDVVTDRMQRGQRKPAPPKSPAKRRSRRAARSRKPHRKVALHRRLLMRILVMSLIAGVGVAAWFLTGRRELPADSAADGIAGSDSQAQSPSTAAAVTQSEFRRSINELGSRRFEVPAEIASVVVSPKGDWFAVTEQNGDGGFSVWSLKTGKQLIDFGLGTYGRRRGDQGDAGFEGAAITPDGLRLLTGQSRGTGTGVFVWSVDPSQSTQQQKFDRLLHPVGGDCRSVSVSRDGSLVATAADFEDRLEELGQRAAVARVRLFHLHDGAWKEDVKISSRRVFDCAFSPTDNHQLATLDSFGILSIWDTRNLSQPRSRFDVLPMGVSRSDSGEVTTMGQGGLAYSPDGQSVTVAFGREVQTWSLSQERRLVSTRAITGTLASVAISPDGKLVATVCLPSNRISLRRTDTLSTLHEFSGHTARIRSVAFVP